MDVQGAGFLRGARAFFAAASLGAAALGAAAGLAGCARKAETPAREAAAPAYPYEASARRVFYATGAGLAEAPAAEAPAAAIPEAGAASRRASAAPNASILTSDGRTILAAVNGWGVERIERSPDGSAYRVAGEAIAGFEGLTTGGAWPIAAAAQGGPSGGGAAGGAGLAGGGGPNGGAGGFIVQLYRDPFGESAIGDGAVTAGGTAPATKGSAAAGPAGGGGRLFRAGREAGAEVLESFAEAAPGFELFALFPAGGRWFAELRAEREDRAQLRFFSAAALEGEASARGIAEIRKAAFENALRPRPLAALPEARRAALEGALGALEAGPRLVRLRDAGGSDGWYEAGGGAEDAAPAYAWTSENAEGVDLLLLCPDGSLARAKGTGTKPMVRRLASLAAPTPAATFTAIAAAGELAAVAWEAGEFPEIEQAGIVIIPTN